MLMVLTSVMLMESLDTPVAFAIADTKPAWCSALKALALLKPLSSTAASIVNVSTPPTPLVVPPEVLLSVVMFAL
jgi:hypothetical protein